MKIILSAFFSIMFFAIIYSNTSEQRLTSIKQESTADKVLIQKKQRKMLLYSKDKAIKEYKISLGFSPIGHKQQEGDGKTPEGQYNIISKNAKSQFHRSLKISYPNKNDKQNAAKKGVSAGGEIIIHGLGKGFSHLRKLHTFYDWTLGCVAVTNEEIEEIWDLVKEGTIVQIEP